jgi:hypothetical protein
MIADEISIYARGLMVSFLRKWDGAEFMTTVRLRAKKMVQMQ